MIDRALSFFFDQNVTRYLNHKANFESKQNEQCLWAMYDKEDIKRLLHHHYIWSLQAIIQVNVRQVPKEFIISYVLY